MQPFKGSSSPYYLLTILPRIRVYRLGIEFFLRGKLLEICKRNTLQASQKNVHASGFSTSGDAEGDDLVEKVTAKPPRRMVCPETEIEAKFTG